MVVSEDGAQQSLDEAVFFGQLYWENFVIIDGVLS
jgi:hypothetical protein